MLCLNDILSIIYHEQYLNRERILISRVIMRDKSGKSVEKTLIALAGEHAVASQLLLRGYYASLTLKNYPEVDIFYFNPKTKKHGSLQVKSAKQGLIWVPKESEKDQLFVLVNFYKGKSDSSDSKSPKSSNSPAFYVIPYSKLYELANLERHLYVTQNRHRKKVDEDKQLFTITLESSTHHPHEEVTKELAKYRDNWDLLDSFS